MGCKHEAPARPLLRGCEDFVEITARVSGGFKCLSPFQEPVWLKIWSCAAVLFAMVLAPPSAAAQEPPVESVVEWVIVNATDENGSVSQFVHQNSQQRTITIIINPADPIGSVDQVLRELGVASLDPLPADYRGGPEDFMPPGCGLVGVSLQPGNPPFLYPVLQEACIDSWVWYAGVVVDELTGGVA